jgi:large subunit ribosomal protein L24
MHVKKGDTVYIRSGDSKGKTGKVLHVDPKKKRVIVEGINMRKRHQRPTQKSPKGGIISIEASIHASNVSVYSSSQGKPVKVGTRLIEEGGKKRRIRINQETGEEI